MQVFELTGVAANSDFQARVRYLTAYGGGAGMNPGLGGNGRTGGGYCVVYTW